MAPARNVRPALCPVSAGFAGDDPRTRAAGQRTRRLNVVDRGWLTYAPARGREPARRDSDAGHSQLSRTSDLLNLLPVRAREPADGESNAGLRRQAGAQLTKPVGRVRVIFRAFGDAAHSETPQFLSNSCEKCRPHVPHRGRIGACAATWARTKHCRSSPSPPQPRR